MAKARKTERGILGTVHKTAAGLHRADVISKATMRGFDVLCLTPAAIKALREPASGSAARSGRTGRR